MAASDRGNLRHSMAFKVRGVRFFILTSLMATWYGWHPTLSLRNWKYSLNKFQTVFCILDFFRVGCQRNLNLSEQSKLVRNIKTCPKYPNLFKLFERVRTIQTTCQHHSNVSTSFERVSIIWTSQYHVNELSSSECGKLVKILNTVKLSMIFNIEINLLRRIIQFL